MSNIVRLIQGSDEWHQHRLLYRNASETAAVMGLSPWLTPYGLWEIKTGRRTQECNYVMQRGLELEPLARQAYERDTGSIMEPAVMVLGDYSASLDGLTFDGSVLLEAKCPFKGAESETWKQAMIGQVEPHYIVQVQHQLMVSGADRCHFWVFDGQDGILVEVLPDRAAFDQIRSAWDEFWTKFVVIDTPPPITAKDTVIREDQDWGNAASAFITAKEAAEEAAKAAEEAKARLVALTSHTSERGYGVSVCRYWKGRKNSQEEVRVTVLKQEQGEERC
jgi:putative phage-type endonuclease